MSGEKSEKALNDILTKTSEVNKLVEQLKETMKRPDEFTALCEIEAGIDQAQLGVHTFRKACEGRMNG